LLLNKTLNIQVLLSAKHDRWLRLVPGTSKAASQPTQATALQSKKQRKIANIFSFVSCFSPCSFSSCLKENHLNCDLCFSKNVFAIFSEPQKPPPLQKNGILCFVCNFFGWPRWQFSAIH